MTITDDYIIEKYQPRRKKVICKIDEEYLSNRFENINKHEALYLILHNYTKPTCPICGKQLTWVGSPRYYNNTCGEESCKSAYITLRMKETCLSKYGVDNVAKIPDVIQSIKHTNLQKYGTECALQNNEVSKKRKQTLLEKYGTDIPQKLDVIKDKIKQSIKKTCLEKYGVDNVSKLKETNDKRIQTCNDRYGKGSVINPIKICESKRKNGTFNTSKPEEESFNIIKAKYPDVIRQYKSDKYPFNCDFYIPSIDTYIECQYNWTHGGHPYDPNNIDDVIKLQQLQEKYGDKWWHTWVERDPKKRKIAKENKINLIEIWSTNELIAWISKMQ